MVEIVATHSQSGLVGWKSRRLPENLMRQEMEDELRRFLHPIVYLRDSAVTARRHKILRLAFGFQSTRGLFNFSPKS